MKQYFLILIALFFSSLICYSQNVEKSNPLSFIDNLSKNRDRNYYSLCSEEITINHPEENGFFTDHGEFLITVQEIENGYFKEKTEGEILERQLKFHKRFIDYFSSKNPDYDSITQEFIELSNRGASVTSYSNVYKNENLGDWATMRNYGKVIFLWERGDFNGIDTLYSIDISDFNKSKLDFKYQKLLECFKLKAPLKLKLSKTLSYYSDFKAIMELGNDYEKAREEWYSKYNFEVQNQGKIYKNEESYKSTRTFPFNLKSRINGSNNPLISQSNEILDVTIGKAKDEKRGYCI